MKLILPFLAGIATAVTVSLYFRHPSAVAVAQGAPRFAPHFPSQRAEDWLNSPPLSWPALRGKVVLLSVVTADCADCAHSWPWLGSLLERYRHRGLRVIVIGASEASPGKNAPPSPAASAAYGLEFPVLLDAGATYSRQLGSPSRPAWYLIGKHGLIRGLFVGETLEGSHQAEAIEAELQRLLEER